MKLRGPQVPSCNAKLLGYIRVILGLCWVYIRVILGLIGVILGLYLAYIGVMLWLYWG